jgi:uncharacterized protein YraI
MTATPALKRVNLATLLLVAVVAVPATSIAQQMAATASTVNLRAGPARDYPVVAVVPGGVAIEVMGCMSDYQWCDVIAGPNRGWVYAGNIVYPYENRQVPLLGYGAALGIGIIAFDLGGYWDQNYRGRPWYGQRQRWIGRPNYGYGGGYGGGYRPPVHVPGRGQGWQQGQHPGGGRPMPGRGPDHGGRPSPDHGPGAGPRPSQGQQHGPRPQGQQQHGAQQQGPRGQEGRGGGGQGQQHQGQPGRGENR